MEHVLAVVSGPLMIRVLQIPAAVNKDDRRTALLIVGGLIHTRRDLAAVARRDHPPPRRNQRPARSPETLRDRIADLTSRGRAIANQFVALYNSAHSARDREFILEAATELRMM